MERAVLVPTAARLARTDPEGAARLYFGGELCQERIPTEAELADALGFAHARGLGFTLLTPPVSAGGIARLERLLAALADLEPRAEVVANDLGAIHLMDEMSAPFGRVLGRMLTKQKRGPRIMNCLSGMPEEARRYFRRSCADSAPFLSFLRDHDVRRVELDNPLQGLEVELAGTGVAGSLYVPYGYVSSSRYCVSARCDEPGEVQLFEIGRCRRECDRYRFVLRNRNVPVPLYLKGNAYLYRNDRLPSGLEAMGIDRIVHEPDLPA